MRFINKEKLDISIVMPCLNEAATVGVCVDEAINFIASHGLKGEVIVVDNNSTDSSADEAAGHGAKVVKEKRKGYGAAIRRGLKNTSGRVVVIGDCDTTYDFSALEEFYYRISAGKEGVAATEKQKRSGNGKGCDMVIGDRFAYPMEKGAMPITHKLGVRFLSACGRAAFRTDVRDFHCGLRSISRSAMEKLKFGTSGMEFATEMIALAAKSGLKIEQVPTKLKVCHFKRKSKLRAVRDGMRHLGYIVNRGKER